MPTVAAFAELSEWQEGRAYFAANLEEVEEQIEMHVSNDSVLLVMGAGSIGGIPSKLMAKGKNYGK